MIKISDHSEAYNTNSLLRLTLIGHVYKDTHVCENGNIMQELRDSSELFQKYKVWNFMQMISILII